ncbi:MAG: MerR family DNA-binding protein [Pseudomonadota bacterium]
MTISDAAKSAGLPTKTVRYYSDIGLVAPVGRSEAGYRIYDDVALKKLSFVKRARGFGFSVEECRELLGLYEDADRSSSDVRTIAAQRLIEIEAKQRELQLLHDELALLVKACKGNDRPDCPILSGLAGDAYE